MSRDISAILAGWDHDPDELQVRIVAGDDGRDKLQMRLDLGLLQMEIDGRPDGQRPDGFDSLLDCYEAKAEAAQAEPAGGSSAHDDEPDVLEFPSDDEPAEDEEPLSSAPFSLDRHDCELLLREGLQYYHRYLALFHVERYDLVARDTTRNLRLFAFVVRYARRPQDKLQFDQYRPYVLTMRARALGLQAIAREDHREALGLIDATIEQIQAFLIEYKQTGREQDCTELSFLRQWRKEIERSRPVGPVERLEQQLDLAVELERFEEAARLRDQIRRLRHPSSPSDTAPGLQPHLPA